MINWKVKAVISTLLGVLPFGEALYRRLQFRLGRISADPFRRMTTTVELIRFLENGSKGAKSGSFFEVGTGHKPIVPIVLSLLGAKSVTTVDLNRRLSNDLLTGALQQIVDQPGKVTSILNRDVSEGLSQISRLLVGGNTNDILSKLRITYQAPADARQTSLPNESIDCHFSVTTLEHIPENTIYEILIEAHRILKPDGVLVHFIDLSDHFSHIDGRISAINFLKFGDLEWKILAGNPFSYCNRLRAIEYIQIFKKAGFEIILDERIVDERSLRELNNRFQVNSRFKNFSNEELATIRLRILAKKRSLQP